MRAWLSYTALRFLLLACVVVVLLLLGLEGFPLLLVAVLGSSVLSLFFLRPQRAALVAAQQQRLEQRRAERQALRDRLEGDDAEGAGPSYGETLRRPPETSAEPGPPQPRTSSTDDGPAHERS